MKNTIPSILSLVKLMELLSKSDDGLSQMEAAKLIGASSSTTYRMLTSLVSCGWIRKNAAGRFHMSLGFLPLVDGFHRQLLDFESARACIHKFAREKNVSAKLTVRHGFDQVVVAREMSYGQTVVSSNPNGGELYALCEGTSGAALVVDESEERLEYLYDEGARRYQMSTSFESVQKAIKQIRAKGWAANQNVMNWKIGIVSAPIRAVRGPAAVTRSKPGEKGASRSSKKNASGGVVVASVSLIVPCDEFDEKKLGALLMELVKRCQAHA